VLQRPWHGSGVTELLADGVIGLRSNQPIKIAAE
jgi:hypothetical protein